MAEQISIVRRAAFIDSARLASVSGVAAETVFLALAVLLPALCHVVGVPVFVVLPMHWTVLLSALTLGWQAGLIVGALAPALSFVTTGMPVPAILPAMTLELIGYGLVPALLHQKGRLNSFFSLAVGLLVGRAAFAAVIYGLGRSSAPLFGFLQNAFGPGLWAAAVQILVIPFLALGVTPLLRRR
jgi:riboflavin transporter FmnP